MGSLDLGRDEEFDSLNAGEVTTERATIAEVSSSGSLDNTQSVSENTLTKVEVTEDHDNLGIFDGANHKFVIADAGKYIITCGIGFNNAGDSNSVGTSIYLNGSRHLRSRQHPTSDWIITAGLTVIMELSAGDEIDLRGEFNGGSDDGDEQFYADATYIGVGRVG